MHIAYLSHALIPSRSANSVNIMKMCAAFRRNGHDVTLLIPDRPGRDNSVVDSFGYYGVDSSFTVERRPWGAYVGRSHMYAVRSAFSLKERQVDLVYTRFFSGAVAALHLTSKKVVFEAHSPADDQGVFGRRLLSVSAAKSSFARLVVISDALRDRYASDVPKLKSRIVVAHDAADLISGNVGPSISFDRMRGGITVGYAGQLYRGKGMELIAKIAPMCPWAQFHVVGGVGVDVEQWREQVQHVPNLHLHGFVPPAQVPRYLSAFDILLAPYQRTVSVYGAAGDVAKWMSPLKLFEYMAAGKPIVCSDLPVLREVMRHEGNGLLCNPDDPHAWVSALMLLRDRPDLRSALAANALSDFEAHYTWTARAKRVLADL